MHDVILVINSGSSGIKFSVFSIQKKLNLLYHAEIKGISDSPCLTISDKNNTLIYKKNILTKGYETGLKTFFNWFEGLLNEITLKAVGHRVVHGGQYFSQATIVTDDVMEKMANLNSLAPLHQPHDLEAIMLVKEIYPSLLQIACFDTMFHHTQEKLATLFAIPNYLTDQGIIRYGFHGISYDYIASVITNYIGDIGKKRVIVAHLGNGASMCAMLQCSSVATSMGFSTLDGLMMGSRCGRIDPGVILYLLKEKKYSEKEVEHILYNESGLLGVSGASHDMQTLLSSTHEKAREAIDLFCYRAALEFGSLSVALGGCDALIFTAGIGENAPLVRQKICERLTWLGITINNYANETNEKIISDSDSKVIVSVIPTNEAYRIAEYVKLFCR